MTSAFTLMLFKPMRISVQAAVTVRKLNSKMCIADQQEREASD